MSDGTKNFKFASFYSENGNDIKQYLKKLPLHYWEHISFGLNLKGQCKNKDCIANKQNKPIWSRQRFGIFSMAEVIRKT